MAAVLALARFSVSGSQLKLLSSRFFFSVLLATARHLTLANCATDNLASAKLTGLCLAAATGQRDSDAEMCERVDPAAWIVTVKYWSGEYLQGTTN